MEIIPSVCTGPESSPSLQVIFPQSMILILMLPSHLRLGLQTGIPTSISYQFQNKLHVPAIVWKRQMMKNHKDIKNTKNWNQNISDEDNIKTTSACFVYTIPLRFDFTGSMHFLQKCVCKDIQVCCVSLEVTTPSSPNFRVLIPGSFYLQTSLPFTT